MNRESFNKHKDLILAWAVGVPIQYFSNMRDVWCDVDVPSWGDNYQYRIKPVEPRVWYIPIYYHGGFGYPRDEDLYKQTDTSDTPIKEWIRVVEDTSFVPDKQGT